jgi:hypothetical protein
MWAWPVFPSRANITTEPVPQVFPILIGLQDSTASEADSILFIEVKYLGEY